MQRCLLQPGRVAADPNLDIACCHVIVDLRSAIWPNPILTLHWRSKHAVKQFRGREQTRISEQLRGRKLISE